MDYRRLGRSEIDVSVLCLGTMTWGVQNNQAEAFEQMDHALAEGINFFDTAEMYPVKQSAETYGRTEEIIGDWMAQRGTRDQVVIATKVVGPGGFPYIRGGKTRHNRAHIRAAIDSSLQRLKTDRVDLYQLHWPDRSTNTFGELAYRHDPDEEIIAFVETLGALDELVREGKTRTVGLSNENPWGAMKFLALSEAGRGPRMASVQNPYNLLNRSFETRLSEVAIREDCGLLAYAPLAAGALSGKYLDDAWPEGARRTLWPENKRYQGPQADKATRAYVELASRHGLNPAHLAIAFVVSRPFVTAAIIGATTIEQLRMDIAAQRLILSSEVLEEIEEIHRIYTYPCP